MQHLSKTYRGLLLDHYVRLLDLDRARLHLAYAVVPPKVRQARRISGAPLTLMLTEARTMPCPPQNKAAEEGGVWKTLVANSGLGGGGLGAAAGSAAAGSVVAGWAVTVPVAAD